MKPRAIIFDVDGVLLDSEQANICFYQELFRRIAKTQPSADELRSGKHLSVEAMLRQVFPNESSTNIESWKALADTIDAGFAYLRPMPGVLELVPRLSEQFTLCLATNRTNAGVEELWRVVPLASAFTVIASFESTEKHKPDPQPLEYILANTSLQPSEAVFVGDAKTDLQAGQAAHVPTIILGQEHWPGAWKTISTFHELELFLT